MAHTKIHPGVWVWGKLTVKGMALSKIEFDKELKRVKR